MSNVGVKQFGTVGMTWFYSVDVPEGLSGEDATAFALQAVKAGDIDPYDTETGDSIDRDDDEIHLVDCWQGPDCKCENGFDREAPLCGCGGRHWSCGEGGAPVPDGQ